MKVYAKEVELGISQKILASCLVKAFCPVKPSKNPSKIAAVSDAHAKYLQTEAGRAFAKYNDLYYVDTVLVTACVSLDIPTYGRQKGL
jgi:hypothetical protein